MAGTAVVGAMYAYRRYYESATDAHTIHQLLNSGYDGLAVDAVEEGIVPIPGTMESAEGTAMVGSPAVSAQADLPKPKTGMVEYTGNPTVVDLHRRVNEEKSHEYMNAVIAECKIKFGVPSNTTANRKAIERFAANIMKKHGVRPTHIRKYLPIVTKMTFVPDQWQVEAERLAGTRSAWKAVMGFLTNNATSVAPREDLG